MIKYRQLFASGFASLICRPEIFTGCCQFILLGTGSAKVLSYLLVPEFQNAKDTVFPGMTVREVFFFAGLCELCVVAALARLHLLPQLLSLYWLGLGIAYYRAANLFLGGGRCSCLGKISELNPAWRSVTNVLLILFLLLMIFGSVFHVLRLLALKRAASGEMVPKTS